MVVESKTVTATALLRELRVKNYAVIEDISLRLESGLSVLTGETGAGKSILVDALSLALGERASADVIRAGEDRAVIEAAFEISERQDLRALCDERGVEVEDGWLVLKREIQAAGRNRAWINGSPATATLVGEIGQALVDLHGQHEHQTLLHAGPQRDILDSFGEAEGLAEEMRTVWAELQEVREKLSKLRARREETQARADLLRHQLEEIEAAQIKAPDEDERLAEEERKLAHAEELLERASTLYEATYASDRSVLDQLGDLRRQLSAMSKLDPGTVTELSELLESAYISVKELGERLGGYRDEVDLNPAKLQRVRERIDTLYRLKSKHGGDLGAVIEAGESAREELQALDVTAFELEELSGRRDELSRRAGAVADRLTKAREKAAADLSSEVTAMLPELGIPDGRFEVSLERRPELASTGAEEVRFLVALNRGFEPRPLSRVASGGELSRVMLALKTILARLDRTPTLIFDEIDAGIGGIVGQKVAERLRAVARHHQVFVITHLAQIAALADHQLLVVKTSRGEQTTTRVEELEGEDRIRDLARMLGGDPERDASLEHARALLERATVDRDE